ncbi:MAG: dienelactone hydrolase family protein [Chloroflexi bacterium]|nr:dienelactone hydrolase family protein [Chloroflexota bacterium]
MCYDNNARPPEHGIGGGGSGAEATLTASDGNTFMAFVAQADQPKDAQILIYPDVRGLHPFYKELALRFADAGYTALAMDYFGRTAGLTAREDSFEFMPHMGAMTWPTFTNDVRASVAHLRSLSPTPQPIFTVGFCMGGALSLYSSMEDLGLTGVIGFYAGMRRAWIESKGTLPDAGVHARIPVLGLFGGGDPGIPAEQVHALDAALDRSGVSHAIHSYGGAPHSFFDRRYAEWKEACDDAWGKIFGFIEGQGKTG